MMALWKSKSFEPAKVSCLFVYGTLRPDDDSGAVWNDFTKDTTVRKKGRVYGARLYFDTYPVAVLESFSSPSSAPSSSPTTPESTPTVSHGGHSSNNNNNHSSATMPTQTEQLGITAERSPSVASRKDHNANSTAKLLTQPSTTTPSSNVSPSEVPVESSSGVSESTVVQSPPQNIEPSEPAQLNGNHSCNDNTMLSLLLQSSGMEDAALAMADSINNNASGNNSNGNLSKMEAPYIVGYFLKWNEREKFNEKLEEADAIEGYPYLYKRTVVRGITEDGDIMDAWVYHRYSKDVNKGLPIHCGDWLLRPKTVATAKAGTVV